MANNLRVFDLINDYNNADLVKPSVSYVVENDKVYYDDAPSPTFQGKWLATYTGGTTSSAECDSSSEIYQYDIDGIDLVSVEIGNCVTSIGDFAFIACESLTSINIPSSVTSIGESTFNGCHSLTSINIPSGVTSIGEYAFYYCSSLTSVTVEATTPPTLGFDAFDGSTCPIYVPSASVNAYKTATNWSEYASRIQPIPTE